MTTVKGDYVAQRSIIDRKTIYHDHRLFGTSIIFHLDKYL